MIEAGFLTKKTASVAAASSHHQHLLGPYIVHEGNVKSPSMAAINTI